MDKEKNTSSKLSFVFTYIKSKIGLLGILNDYPQADKICKALISRFDVIEASGGRRVQSISIKINEKYYSFVIKGKVRNNTFISLNSGSSKKTFTHSSERLNFSVLYELFVNMKVKRKYEYCYGGELTLEKPVGFFISSRPEDKGARWVIFEQIDVVTEKVDSTVEENKKEYEKEIRRRLKEIGIINRASFGKRAFDVLIAGNRFDPYFVIVDSEDWYIEKSE